MKNEKISDFFIKGVHKTLDCLPTTPPPSPYLTKRFRSVTVNRAVFIVTIYISLDQVTNFNAIVLNDSQVFELRKQWKSLNLIFKY